MAAKPKKKPLRWPEAGWVVEWRDSDNTEWWPHSPVLPTETRAHMWASDKVGGVDGSRCRVRRWRRA